MKSYQQLFEERINKEKALLWTVLLSGGLLYSFDKIMVWSQQQIEQKIDKTAAITIIEVPKPLPKVEAVKEITRKIRVKSNKHVKLHTKWKAKPKWSGGKTAPRRMALPMQAGLLTSTKKNPVKEPVQERASSLHDDKGVHEKAIKIPNEYGNSYHNAHATNGLDMDGWTFKDDLNLENISNEEGFVKFEIILNSKGEIQAINTLGKSLLPSTITMYKNYLRSKASFVRTIPGNAPATSRGTLTINVRFT